MQIQIWDRHRDRIGGGTMPMIALHNALTTLGHDVFVVDTFHPDIESYEFIEWPGPIRVKTVPDPDIFIYNCYWENTIPRGKQNWLYVLYPKPNWDVSAWDRIITTSEFSRDAIKQAWGRDADILVGGVYADDWYPYQRKRNAILSCSRFFIEGRVDALVGHSKNQHILVQAFRDLDPKGWQLWMAGSVLTEQDGRYLDKCRELARGDDRIKFFPTPDRRKLKSLYGAAKIFWHAMGYKRTNPAETEHYGYVLLKACLSGHWVATHNSGNTNFSNIVWDTPEELQEETGYMLDADKWLPTHTHLTRQHFVEQVEAYLESCGCT